jgi:putative transposase
LEYRGELSLQRCCELLSINRSTVYYQQVLPEDDDVLCNRISEIYQQFPCYGYRKITAVLRHEGLTINHKRVQRLMRYMGIQAIYAKPRLSQPNKVNSVYPYLLSGLAILRPNQVWAVDITYIKLPVGMAYLFALIDWYSRFIVGWQLANSMTADHGLAALESGLVFGKPDICNADQGSQFTGSSWVTALHNLGIKVSHDGIGRCIDNVRIERFWRTIKYEDLYLRQYQDLVEARAGINNFITHYNYHRPHQALRYARPADWYCQK